MEFYNLVFMEYDLRPGNELVPLPSQNVDTGLGLERGAMVLQGAASNFDTDGFRLIMDWVEAESGVRYGESELATKAHRVLADHGRAMSFLIADGVAPSNEGRGYICRRIIRRAVQYGQRIGLDRVHRLPAVVVEQMGDAYPELREHAGEIERVVRLEEERFRETLARGLKVFDELAGRDAISAEDAFTLATTYGFPIELTGELAEERGQTSTASASSWRSTARCRARAARRPTCSGPPTSPATRVFAASSSATRRPMCSRSSGQSRISAAVSSSRSFASRPSTPRAAAR
jgi:alanyl-tRNA synthetase